MNPTNQDSIIGMDLGTSFSVVVHKNAAGTPEVSPNRDGDLKTESIVSLAGDVPVVGRAAKPDLILSPQFVGRVFKRYMGKPIPLLTDPKGHEWRPEDLSALVLKDMKLSVEAHLGYEVRNVVVTVPAYFGELGREATKAAARMAGFERVVLAEEPVAAATYFHLEKGEDGMIAVIDWGGGTLDVAVVEKNGTEILSKLVHGDSELGGTNYDEAVLQLMKVRLHEAGAELDSNKDLATWYQNLDRAREAKEMLSKREAVVLVAEAEGKRVPIKFTRADLLRVGADLDERFRKCCREVLEKLGAEKARIRKVLAVGGSMRLFHVSQMLTEIFGITPSLDADPDLVVAKGAAIHAAIAFSQDDRPILVGANWYLPSQIRTQSVSAHSICVAALKADEETDTNEYNVLLIPQGTPLPHEARQSFAPVNPRTGSVTVKIVEGKPGELSGKSTLLKEFEVPVQPSDKSEQCIEVVMKFTKEALLEVEAWDKRLNQRVSVKFTYQAGLSDAEINTRKELIHVAK
jgi:molecular chaperone DnaK